MRLPFGIQRAVARTALRWYYRDIEITGTDLIPTTGPVLLAANHNNALVDALVVMACVDREVRLTAKATLLNHPITRAIVHLAGVVPLRRRRDETGDETSPTSDRNAEAFAEVTAALSAGAMILIFPEGVSHSHSTLAPLRTGCARMALQAAAAGVRGITIVPLGLTFEQKGTPRTRVALAVGPPIRIDELPTKTDGVVDHVTSLIDAGLRHTTLNVDSTAEAARVLRLSRILTRLDRPTRSLDAPDPPLTDTVRLAQMIDDVQRRRAELPSEVLQSVIQFVERLDQFRERSLSLGVSIGEVGLSTSSHAGVAFALRESLIALCLAPVVLWSRVNHTVPLAVARLIGRATSRNLDEPAMHTIIAGFCCIVAWYAAGLTIVGLTTNIGLALIYVCSLPPSALIDFWATDRWRGAWRRVRAFVQLRRAPAAQRQLTLEARALRTEATALRQQLFP